MTNHIRGHALGLGRLTRFAPWLALAIPFVLAACGNNGSAGY